MSTTVKVYGMDGSAKGSAELPDELFAQPVHEHLLWLAVKRHLGNQRQGTAKVKAKGEVSGGGRKPWRQKGTGRARRASLEVLPQPAEPEHDAGRASQRPRPDGVRGGAAHLGRAAAGPGGVRPMKNARSIVRRALVTEKGTVLREQRNQYVFEV